MEGVKTTAVVSKLCCPGLKLTLIQYHLMQMIPVAANDVAFSVHAVTLTAFTLSQVLIYEVS